MKRAVLGLGWVGLSAIVTVAPVNAQAVVSDGSLNTIVTRSNNTFTIDNGTPSGTNLFHSFQEFSIPTSGAAIFNNATNIQNIFARVTGGTVSNIDGAIQTNGTANLFLLNPAGILFGANASLNVGGSFVGTSAQVIKFADGTELSATNASQPPLLTMSVPIGLQMGTSPGAITVQNTGHQLEFPINPFASSPDRSQNPTGLSVKPGKTLALVGGAISLEGGVLNAPSGHIELGSTSNGTVTLDTSSPLWRFGYQNLQQFGDIQLTQQSLADASGSPAGSIHFQGHNVRLNDGSAALLVNQGSDNAGNIQVNATGSVELQGTGTPGFPQSLLRADNFGSGSGGNILVSASQLVLHDGGSLHGFNFGAGTGSNISVEIRDLLQLVGLSPLSGFASSVNTQTAGSGNSGNVQINTGRLQILGGAVVGNSTSGTGLGGNTTINAAHSIEISGEDPLSKAASVIVAGTFSKANAGQLTINAPIVKVWDGGGIVASTVNDGNGGNLSITAFDRIEVQGVGTASGLPSRIGARADVLAPPIRQLFGLPDPENITGDTGELTLTTSRLEIRDGAIVGVDHPGQGNAGNLHIQADELVLDRGGKITAETVSGEGGNINLQVQELLFLRRGSRISSEAGGTGNGGNITINAPVILAVPLENSDIIANAYEGKGGNIQITTQGILGLQYRDRLTPDNDITASSKFGVNGSVQVNNIGVDPNAALAELADTLLNPNQQVASGCSSTEGSSFIITGRGGMPQNPIEHIVRSHPWVDLRAFTPHATPTATALPASRPLLEASDWHRNPQTGKVELIAAKPVTASPNATCAIAQ